MLFILLCCCNCGNDLQEKKISSDNSEYKKQSRSFILSSTDFFNGGVIPTDCACKWLGGKNLPPQLRWINVPSKTESFALIMDDETHKPGDEAVKHWAVFNIPVSFTEFASEEDKVALDKDKITKGRNYTEANGYAGPCPPNKHVYSFTVFALRKDMPFIETGKEFTRSQFKREYSNYIINSATLSGSYTPSKSRLLLNKVKNVLSKCLK